MALVNIHNSLQKVVYQWQGLTAGVAEGIGLSQTRGTSATASVITAGNWRFILKAWV